MIGAMETGEGKSRLVEYGRLMRMNAVQSFDFSLK